MPDLVERARQSVTELREQFGDSKDLDLLQACADEVWLLRRIVEGVRVMANAGAFKEYEGEPWLLRVRNIDLTS